MTVDLVELRKLAEKATPGEWSECPGVHSPPAVDVFQCSPHLVHKEARRRYDAGTQPRYIADSAFIGACSPSVVLELCDQLVLARRLVEHFGLTCSQCGEPFYEPACGPTHALVAADPSQYDRTAP